MMSYAKEALANWDDERMADSLRWALPEIERLQAKVAGYEHDERVVKIGFCAITNCKLCPSPYDKPKTRTPCSYHKGFKEDCGCP